MNLFFLLKVETTDLGFELKISGSTRNIYTIQINNNSRNLKCDCPDSRVGRYIIIVFVNTYALFYLECLKKFTIKIQKYFKKR